MLSNTHWTWIEKTCGCSRHKLWRQTLVRYLQVLNRRLATSWLQSSRLPIQSTGPGRVLASSYLKWCCFRTASKVWMVASFHRASRGMPPSIWAWWPPPNLSMSSSRRGPACQKLLPSRRWRRLLLPDKLTQRRWRAQPRCALVGHFLLLKVHTEALE